MNESFQIGRWIKNKGSESLCCNNVRVNTNILFYKYNLIAHVNQGFFLYIHLSTARLVLTAYMKQYFESVFSFLNVYAIFWGSVLLSISSTISSLDNSPLTLTTTSPGSSVSSLMSISFSIF